MPTSSADIAGPPVLDVIGLSAGYSDVPVVSDISLQVRASEVVALLGPNGAGKSTVLKAIVGEARVHSGTVFLRGADVTGSEPERLAKLGLGYVPQTDNVFHALTVAENLEMGAYLVPRRQVGERLDAVMEQFPVLQILSRRQVARLSGGERRLVAIGRALVLRPSVLLLDEPTANLSPANARAVLQDYVAEVAAGGTAVLVVEQRAKEALQSAGHALILTGGRVSVSGPAGEMMQRRDIGRLFLGEAAEETGPPGVPEAAGLAAVPSRYGERTR